MSMNDLTRARLIREAHQSMDKIEAILTKIVNATNAKRQQKAA